MSHCCPPLSGLAALRTTNTPASCSRNLRPQTRTVVSRHICHWLHSARGSVQISQRLHQVACILFVHHIVPKRKLPYPSACCLLLPEHSLRYQRFQESSTRSQSVRDRVLFALSRGSWPPSDLLPNRCMLQRMPGCVLMSFHRPLPYPSLLQCGPYANLCAAGCTYGFGANWHPRLQHPQQRLARGAPSMVHRVGRAPGHEGGQGIE